MSATERDRETAAELLADVHSGWCGALRDHPSPGPCICRLQGIADAIVAALAAERERVLAPVLAALDALSRETGAYEAGYKSWAQTETYNRDRYAHAQASMDAMRWYREHPTVDDLADRIMRTNGGEA